MWNVAKGPPTENGITWLAICVTWPRIGGGICKQDERRTGGTKGYDSVSRHLTSHK